MNEAKQSAISIYKVETTVVQKSYWKNAISTVLDVSYKMKEKAAFNFLLLIIHSNTKLRRNKQIKRH